MSGFFEDHRPSMNKRNMFCSVSRGYNAPKSKITKPLNRAFNQYFADGAVDSVRSFRTGKGAMSDELYRMLQNKDYNVLGNGDIGHEFNTTKYYVSNAVTPFAKLRDSYNGRDWTYDGPVGIFAPDVVGANSSTWNGVGSWGWTDDFYRPVPATLGTKAIAAIAPTKSNANIAASLMELGGGFPKLIGSSLRKKKGTNQLGNAVGDEYLNLMFGWVPTLSDIKSIAVAMVNAPKIIGQYQRDADRVVRRRYYFPTEIENTFGGNRVSNWRPILASPGFDMSDYIGSTEMRSFQSRGDRTITATMQKETKTWFSGAFRYHLNMDDSTFGRIERTAQIAGKWLGVRPDLAAFWQVMPWSWFIDWFVDIGSIIENANHQALDGQVLQYGYLMRQTTVRRTYTTDAPWYFQGDTGETVDIGHLTTTFVSQRKERVKATPFGFGLNPDSFSAQQWSILGALGLTKKPGKLF